MNDRRRYVRLALARPVKLRCMVTGRFLSGQTENLSTGGALIRIEHPSVLVPGQRVNVGIAHHARQVILREDDFARATVVRSLGLGGSQNLAVQFDQPLALAATG